MSETILTVPRVLTPNCYEFLIGNFSTIAQRQDIYNWLMSSGGIDAVSAYTIINYTGLKALPMFANLNPDASANLIYKVISDSFIKVFDVLTNNYNPFENFYTSGTFTDVGEGENVRTGVVTDTPTGSKIRTYNGHSNVGQGTTFESYGDNDFKNIAKNIESGSIQDTFQNYSNQRIYNNLKDASTASKTSTENKNGSSGIFSKQVLAEQEVKLRLSRELFPLFIWMCVAQVTAGVWINED